MPEISVEIEVWCSCGNGLCNQTITKTGYRGEQSFVVEPCEKCMDNAHREGYQDGYDDRATEVLL